MIEPLWRVRAKVEQVSKGSTDITFSKAQIGRDSIMETIGQVRNEGIVQDRPGFGRWALSIPFEDFEALKAKYPDLASKDQQIKTRAYQAFIASEESRPYRMRDKV